MTISRPMQLGILALLCLLMLATRGQHFASIDALPSASWAVFFLAGLLFRPAWGFLALFALATVIDLSQLESGDIGAHCLSPSYWTLLPAYAALWFSGRWYAGHHQDRVLSLLPLGLSMIVGGFVAYLCSGGGFYFLSGRDPAPTLAGFASRIVHYYPMMLGNLVLYVAIAAMIYVAVRASRGTSVSIAAR